MGEWIGLVGFAGSGRLIWSDIEIQPLQPK